MLEENKNDFFYAMKRPFDIGCQPIGQKGLVSPTLLQKINEDIQPNIIFQDVVRYGNELSIEDVLNFELKQICFNDNKWTLA